MSEWFYKLPSTPGADWLILIVMLYEMYRAREHNALAGQVPGSRLRRYWPWALAGVVATIIAWLPVFLTRPIQPSIERPHTHDTPRTITPTIEQYSNENTQLRAAIKSMELEQKHQFDAVAIAELFLGLPEPCSVKIFTAERDNEAINRAGQFAHIIGHATRCQLIEPELMDPRNTLEDRDIPPRSRGDPGITVRGPKEKAEKIVKALDGQNLIALKGSKVSEGLPPDALSIEFGPGSPWKQ